MLSRRDALSRSMAADGTGKQCRLMRCAAGGAGALQADSALAAEPRLPADFGTAYGAFHGSLVTRVELYSQGSAGSSSLVVETTAFSFRCRTPENSVRGNRNKLLFYLKSITNLCSGESTGFGFSLRIAAWGESRSGIDLRRRREVLSLPKHEARGGLFYGSASNGTKF